MKKYVEENKKMLLNAALSIVVIILILSIALFMHVNKESDTEKFNNMVLAVIENIKKQDITDEYILVEFPDKEEIVSKNGKLISSTGKKYKSFTEGYIIRYKDESYAFKLSNGSYCAYKNYNETKVNIDLENVCENFEIEYK